MYERYSEYLRFFFGRCRKGRRRRGQVYRSKSVRYVPKDALALGKLQSGVLCIAVRLPPAPTFDHVAGREIRKQAEGTRYSRPEGMARHSVDTGDANVTKEAS